METTANRSLPRVARAVRGTKRLGHRTGRHVRHATKACNFSLKMELHIRGIHSWSCRNNDLSAIPPRIHGIRHHRYDTYYRQNFPESCHVIQMVFFYLLFLCWHRFFGWHCKWMIEAGDRIIDTGRVVVNIGKTHVLAQFYRRWSG